MKKLILLPFLILFGLSGSVTALDLGSVSDSLGISVGGYGASGCGWGTQLWKGIPGKPANIAASITNGLLSNQAFGMSSGTSGCKANGPVVQNMSKEQTVFVAVNYDNLSMEMSRGQGEYLVAYAELLGCPSDRLEKFGAVTKNNYKNIFGAENQPVNVLLNTKTAIRSDSELAATCTRVNS